MISIARKNKKNKNYLEDLPFQKPSTLRSQSLYLSYKRDRCEVCGSTSLLGRHHIIHRSQGGSDEHENLIILCGAFGNNCHGKAHSGEISAEELKGLKVRLARVAPEKWFPHHLPSFILGVNYLRGNKYEYGRLCNHKYY